MVIVGVFTPFSSQLFFYFYFSIYLRKQSYIFIELFWTNF